jgi:hypothetical protein
VHKFIDSRRSRANSKPSEKPLEEIFGDIPSNRRENHVDERTASIVRQFAAVSFRVYVDEILLGMPNSEKKIAFSPQVDFRFLHAPDLTEKQAIP